MKNKINELTPVYSISNLSICLGVPVEVLLDISDKSPKLYSPFKIPKVNGGFRKIDNPQPKLKAIQKKILKNILEQYTLPVQIMGGRKKYSIKDYLTLHINKPEVVSLDIKKCFPSTGYKQVFKVFRENYGYSRKNSSILTKLTTYRGYLPQGAPSSNMLLNIIITPAALEIASLCERSGCQVSFWVDDITISGESPHELIQQVIAILHKNGFAIGTSKTKIMKQSTRQEVLNHIVNRKISVSKSKYSEYLHRYFGKISQDEISGILNYLEYINPKQARRLRKLVK